MLFIKKQKIMGKITKEQLQNFINENYGTYGETGEEFGQPGVEDYWGVVDDMSDLEKYRTEKGENLYEDSEDDMVDYSEEISNWDNLTPMEKKEIMSALKTSFEGSLNEGKVVEVTEEQLSKLVKEGVEKLHRKTLAENRLEQINQELNALNNPEAWQQARDNAQAELEKKTINWQSITQRKDGLISEMSFRDVESMIPKETPKDTATIEANQKWTQVQKESIADIMGRASDLMAEAKKKYNDISK